LVQHIRDGKTVWSEWREEILPCCPQNNHCAKCGAEPLIIGDETLVRKHQEHLPVYRSTVYRQCATLVVDRRVFRHGARRLLWQ
jgi:hypothetical protein